MASSAQATPCLPTADIVLPAPFGAALDVEVLVLVLVPEPERTLVTIDDEPPPVLVLVPEGAAAPLEVVDDPPPEERPETLIAFHAAFELADASPVCEKGRKNKLFEAVNWTRADVLAA